jgi:hypothetical protein
VAGMLLGSLELIAIMYHQPLHKDQYFHRTPVLSSGAAASPKQSRLSFHGPRPDLIVNIITIA